LSLPGLEAVKNYDAGSSKPLDKLLANAKEKPARMRDRQQNCEPNVGIKQ